MNAEVVVALVGIVTKAQSSGSRFVHADSGVVCRSSSELFQSGEKLLS
jgi:hypothetical protein